MVILGCVVVYFVTKSTYSYKKESSGNFSYDQNNPWTKSSYSSEANKTSINTENESESPEEFKKWNNLPIGTTVTLKDEQALEDSLKAGRGLKGVDYTIQKKTLLQNSDGANKWLFLTLESEDQTILLLIKTAGGKVEKRVYVQDEEVSGTRQDLIENGQNYLFQEPPSGDYNPSDLKYTTSIVRQENGREITFNQKRQKEQHGNIVETPTGVRNLFGTIVEYKTSDKCTNPELLILEIGKREAQGNISLYGGSVIKNTELTSSH